MTINNNLLEFMKKQIEIEQEIVASINEALENIQNPSVKSVLKGISLDSVKHAEIYSSAITLLTTVPQALSQEQLDKQIELVNKHIRIEAELIKKITDMLPLVENEKIKLLLSAVLADEKRHHELLKKVLEILVRGETITDDDLWDALWKNVPFHGAPGG